MTLQNLIIRYAVFAVVATIANLATQRVVLLVGEGSRYFMLALAAGTIAGLIIKYLLDKRWIFYDRGAGVKDHGRKFSRYSAMGLATTAIFWGMESVFWLFWQTDMMRELGAVIGLTIGYVVKYNLDRRFVFTDAQLGPAA
ncbi:polysaccharide biosynthesis protein GtrA [Rhodobacterales bacterium 52_120_T64]|nr:polysaccharide biosynthesis protein GtrA [Rhodobacterales bacterium 52_120_T64]